MPSSTPTVNSLLSYLQDGLNKGLRPNTLKRQVSAISSVLPQKLSAKLSTNYYVRRFLRAATLIRPPMVHRYPNWDLHTVLSALTKPPFEPLKSTDIKYLTWKTIFLVAITSAKRVSEMGALSIRPELCVFREDSVVLRLDPSFITKVNSTFHRSQDIILPSFCPHPKKALEKTWHTLDVRRALYTYIKRTQEFRLSDSLFIAFHTSSRGKKVSASTLSRWIRSCILTCHSLAGASPTGPVYAHSTRSASTSAALSTNASLAEICKAATWSSVSTFVRHYRLDSTQSSEAAFGRRVLQAVVPR